MSEVRFTRLVWSGIALGAVALGMASYVQYSPEVESGGAARADGHAHDPIEQLALDAERGLQEAREIAGRARGAEFSRRPEDS